MQTALSIAVEKKLYDFALILVEAGADIYLFSKDDLSVLYAVEDEEWKNRLNDAVLLLK
jgi:hypothetical protein